MKKKYLINLIINILLKMIIKLCANWIWEHFYIWLNHLLSYMS